MRLAGRRGRAPGRGAHLLQYLFAWTFLLNHAVSHDQKAIDAGQNPGPVRDHDHGGSTRGRAQDGLHQSGLAFLIEVGVRLVQDQQDGFAIQGPRQGNTLGLTCRQALAERPQDGVVTLGKPQDQLVGTCRHRRLDGTGVRDVLGYAGGGGKSRDIVLDRTGEQAGHLGQVADVSSQFVAVASIVFGPVQSDGPGLGLERSGDNAGQGGLARAAGPDDAQGLARLQGEGDAAQLWRLGIGEFDRNALDLKPSARGRKGRSFALYASGACKQIGQCLPAGDGLDQAGPDADQKFDGRDRAAEQDGGGDDRARRDVALDGQVGRQPQCR